MGPSCAVPAISAGGAVVEPFPSTWILTSGYCFLKLSDQSVMRLFSVSEPIEFRFPETAPVALYPLMLLSTSTACADAGSEASNTAASAPDELRLFHHVCLLE